MNMFANMYVSALCVCVCVGTFRGQIRVSDPWNWRYR